MPSSADLSLTKEELSLLEAHLREQYRDVFDEKTIQLHINEFVESSFAYSLAAVIAGSSQNGDTLLDIGAGYGAFVLSCRKHGLDAMGFELASFEIDMSRRRLARAEPGVNPTAVFHKGDAGRLPFPDNAFQIVTLLNVIEHVPDYPTVLAEATRVLRPGGRLFVVCPNYAALRKEAHYQVPWLPCFPRSLASAYLRLLGRNPGFFQEHIYYCTNWGVLHALGRLGMRTASLDIIRLEHPELVSGARSRRILNFIHRVRMLPLIKVAFRMNFHNPFKAAVTVVAIKEASR